MRARSAISLLILAAPLLVACNEDTAPPPAPVELTQNDNGYFCQMIVADHPGPKAQIHIAGRSRPLFFPSVIDAIAFLMLPGESKAVRATYVNDMGKAKNWQSPEPGTWIDANSAYFVVGSKLTGGMGHKEAVPFASEAAARSFANSNGGQVVRLAGIPQSYVFPDPNAEEASVAAPSTPAQKLPKEAKP